MVLLSPFVPLLFMGEEWAASTPFPFFASHADAGIAEGTTRGRRREFAAFGWKPDDVPDPMDPATQIGPLVASRQRDRVEGYIAVGQEEGAKIAVGGGRPAGVDKGWYVEPTVFVNVDNKMRIAQEEIFGPVVAVIPYDGEADAVRIANDSSYGLSGSVWTADPARGVDVARKVRTGTYTVNGFTLDFATPFGGFKQSGYGRELGPRALDAYTEVKSIFFSTA